MSNSSDSEEFFDAEDDSNNKLRKAKNSCGVTPSKSETDFQLCLKKDEKRKDNFKVPVKIPSSSAVLSTVSNDSLDKTSMSRSRLKELRKRMQTEDEEPLTVTGNSPTGSQTSSLDGVFTDLETKSSHPFRIIEHDALSLHSLTSLGRSARILSANQETMNSLSAKESMLCNTTSSGIQSSKNATESSPKDESKSCDVSEKNEQVVKLQEPDVIASTKGGSLISVGTPPVAPPRKKKKDRNKANPPNSLPLDKQTQHQPILTKSVSADEGSYSRDSTLPSPSFTIESLAREFENSLDITSAVRGDYVVRPLDPPNLPPQDNAKPFECESSRPTSRRNRVGSRNSSTYPLGASATSSSPMRERRRSAGDEKSLLKGNTTGTSKTDSKLFVRTRTDSGKPLSDLEILEQVTVLNLDTGERVPLSIAEDKLPQCINPLSLHIMRLTSEYVSNTSLEKDKESDGESTDSRKSLPLGRSTLGKDATERRSYQIRKFFGQTVKRTVIRFLLSAKVHPNNLIWMRSWLQDKPAIAMGKNKEDGLEVENDNQQQPPGEQYIKLKASNSHKGPYEFDCLQHVQELSGEHQGPVWCMKFSSCGRLLATAGQDRVLRIWVVTTAYPYFQEMRTKYNGDRVSPSPSQESLASQLSENCPEASGSDDSRPVPFCPKPFCTYSGHTSDLLDISWSKNYFVLSSSMDKTVRLWHISRKECLCCFQHIEFVTAIVFHPRDDRYFLSGSLDGKLRLWNIPDKKVAVWNEVDGQTKLITAANFCQNGKFAVVGSYDGRCIFYNTDQLKYHTQIHVRSSRGKNSTGRKISGIEPMPGEDKILVTSNDSRIRLYDLRDLNLSCKYKGYVNMSSQIRASFSHDGKFIVSGSENQCIYIWKSTHDYSKFTSVRRDRNDYWEGVKVHNATVTCAVFSPNPDIIMKHVLQDKDSNTSGYVLVSADFNGMIKVFINKTKPKHSSLPASAIA